ncbi:hypothetical protein MKX01_034703, partial [Papaver californicum]
MDSKETISTVWNIPLDTLTILHNCSQYFSSVNETKEGVDLDGALWLIQPLSTNNKSSVWNGDDPFNYIIPVFLAQASMTVFCNSSHEIHNGTHGFDFFCCSDDD